MTNNMVKGIIGGDEFLTEFLVRGLTINGPADAYCVSHCTEQQGNNLAAKCGIHFWRNMSDLIPKSAVLFLTFDPADASTMLPKIAEKIQNWTLIVSVVRGLKLATLEHYFPDNEIVRLTLNPSVISGSGLGAYALSQNASADARSMAQIVLKECGEVIAVQNEDELEEVIKYLVANTYFAYMVIQSMISNAKKIGMEPKEAGFAVDKLLKGAMHTIIDMGYDTQGLIRRSMNSEEYVREAAELIKDYGLAEKIIDVIENNAAPILPTNPNDDPKNYKMHYQWSR